MLYKIFIYSLQVYKFALQKHLLHDIELYAQITNVMPSFINDTIGRATAVPIATPFESTKIGRIGGLFYSLQTMTLYFL